MSNFQDSNYPSICAQVNSAFDVRTLMDYIGWHPDKVIRSGDVFLALCPIHRDTVFRSLVLNPRNNTYHCTHLACQGHSASDYLDLIVKVSNYSLPEVMEDAIKQFGADYFRLSDKQVMTIERMVRDIRGEEWHPPAP